MTFAPALLAAGALFGQTVEQIPPPAAPAPTGHVRSIAGDPTRVAQLPPEAVAVDQPTLEPAAPRPDTTVDAARAYATLLATHDTTRDLGARTVAEAAAAAGLTAPPPVPAPTPAPPKAPKP